jgi:hypothetical protein
MATIETFPSRPSRTLRFPIWQSAYQAVLAEANTEKLFKLVEVAEAAALTRRAELRGNPNHHSERKALDEALDNLLLVKKDRLKFG